MELYVCREWRKLTCDERPLLRYVIRRERTTSREACQVERRDDIQHYNLMRRVDIQALVEREHARVVVKRPVRARIVRCDWRVREARYELLNISQALNSCNGRAESVVVPEIEVHSIFKPFPFFLGKEPAELAVTYCNSFVRTQLRKV